MSALLVIAGLALVVMATFVGGGFLLLPLGVALMWVGLAR